MWGTTKSALYKYTYLYIFTLINVWVFFAFIFSRALLLTLDCWDGFTVREARELCQAAYFPEIYSHWPGTWICCKNDRKNSRNIFGNFLKVTATTFLLTYLLISLKWLDFFIAVYVTTSQVDKWLAGAHSSRRFGGL